MVDGNSSSHTERTRLRSRATLQTAAYVLIAAAAGWFLLVQLAPLLRPLLIATFLAYILLPYHSQMRRRVSSMVSIFILAGITCGVLVGLALAVYTAVVGLNDELPQHQERASELARHLDGWIGETFPWLPPSDHSGKQAEAKITAQASLVARVVLNTAADALVEAGVIGLYLLFLLLEASRFPDRVRSAYAPARANEILHIAGQVNAAVVSYLKGKVKSSLFLAVPVLLVLWGFNVRFALLWAVLTFLCNFVPYIGTVVAYTLPTAFGFLQFDLGWQSIAVAVLLLICHSASASIIEPTILGKAVGLSPLVILGSLAFWGLLWGVPGMFLAVPLTAVAAIVMGHFEVTRPVARLVSGGGEKGLPEVVKA